MTLEERIEIPEKDREKEKQPSKVKGWRINKYGIILRTGGILPQIQ
jgi:hypothetical protein